MRVSRVASNIIRTEKGISIMRRFLILLIVAVTAFSIGGCGGGSSADPLGTDSITFVSAGSVGRNGTLLLTATVKSASGAAVVGRDVTFGIVTNETAATLNAGEARTDTAGEATVLYRAGGVSGVDIVRASISNNNSVYRDIAITVGTGGTGELTLNVTPTIISLGAGAQTIITAQVLNEDGKPAAGQTVTFTTDPNNSGAATTPGSSTTNAAGKAFTTYTAGSNSLGSTVFDVVTASVTTAAGSAAAEVLITRTAAAAGGATVNVTSSLSSLRAGAQAIITADVLNPDGTPAAGQTVNFTTDPNNSGATLLPASGTTNAAGEAFATYTAGNNSPGTIVYDVVTASIAGASSGLIITRTAAAAAGVTMTVTASLESLAAGSQSLITAEVLDTDGTPATGQTVTFTTSPNNSGGATAPGSALTNADGKAFATYTAGSLLPGTTVFDVVTASVTGAAGDAADSKIIARTAAAAAGFTMTVTPSLTLLTAGSQSIIAAQVLNADGTPATGQTVTFTTSPSNSGAANPTPGSSPTNADGMAFATYTAGSLLPGSIVFDVVTASVTGAAASAIITRSAATAGTYAVSIGASTTSVTAGQVSVITATVTSGSTAAGGVTVTFTLPVNSSSATVLPATATTDSSGKAVVVYQPGTTSPTLSVQDTVQAAVGTAANTVVITRVGSAASAYGIAVTASPATLTADNSNSVVKATVTSGTTAISGVTVTFTVTGGGTVPAPGTATTDGSGNAVITFTGGPGARATGETDVVTASITVGGNTYTNAVVITYP